MKKTSLILGTFLALFLISCEGPEGLPGLDGLDGSEFEAEAFEIANVDMVLNTTDNRYELLFEPYPQDITIFERDFVLIYRLEEVAPSDNGDVDVWRQLPQPVIINEGTLYYNFDFTLGDYSIFIEPEFDAGLVPTALSQDQVFRIVVVPSNLGLTSKIDKSNINAVLGSLDITESDIQKIEMN